MKAVVIVGAGETADIAYEYFTCDSVRQVVAFAVESAFRQESVRHGLPVINFEEITALYPPETHEVFIAVSYVHLNRLRERLFDSVKALGYRCATYVSSKAFVWRTAQIGENCMVFENNVIQHGVRIEDNVILWSGNHVGHQSVIRRSAYIASHAVVSGYCDIGPRCFIGVNSTIVENTRIAEDCLIAAAAVVTKNTKPFGIYQGNPAVRREGVTALRYFRVYEGSK